MQRLVSAIVGGKFPPGSVLPPASLLAYQLGVDRQHLTVIVCALQACGVIRLVCGRAFINPRVQWVERDPRLLVARVSNGAEIPTMLLEARCILEVGVCELAASRRTEEDLRALALHTEDMAIAVEASDVERFVVADLKFHQAILDASENAVLVGMFDPVRPLLMMTRRQTSEFPAVRRNALKHHRLIYEALRTGNPVAAAASMRGHMAQTKRDLHRYVFQKDSLRTRRPVRESAGSAAM